MKKIILVLFSLTILIFGSIMVQAAETEESLWTSIALSDQEILIVNAQNELWVYTSPMNTYGVLPVTEEEAADLFNPKKYVFLNECKLRKLMDDVSQVHHLKNSILVLKTDGTLWKLERSYGATTDKLAAYAPQLLDSDVKTVSTCNNNLLYIKNDNTLWQIDYDSLWDQDHDNLTTQKIADDVISVSAKSRGGIFIKSDNSLWNWEMTYKLSEDYVYGMQETTTKVMDDVKYAVVYKESHFFIKKDGSLWGWGNNSNGQIGNGGFYDKRSAMSVENSNDLLCSLYYSEPFKILENVKSVYPTDKGIYAVTKDSEVRIWGDSDPMYVDWDWNVVKDMEYRKTVPRIADGEFQDIAGIKILGNYNYVIVKNDGSVWGKGKLSTGPIGIDEYYNELIKWMNPETFESAADVDNFYRAFRDVGSYDQELRKLMEDGVAGQFKTPEDLIPEVPDDSSTGEKTPEDATPEIPDGSSTGEQSSQDMVSIIVNGEKHNTGNEFYAYDIESTALLVLLNNTVMGNIIDDAVNNNATGEENLIQVSIDSNKYAAVEIDLTGDFVKKLEENNFEVSLKFGNAEYIVPAEEFAISMLAKNLAFAGTDLFRIWIGIYIYKMDEENSIEIYSKVEEDYGVELVCPPVWFGVTANITISDSTTEKLRLSKFNKYVENILEIPAGVDPETITTGIFVNPDGTIGHVPTEVYQDGEKWYARLNSQKTSFYSIIRNPITVESVENHWAGNTVNELASRLIIFDPETFDPDKTITRADFAEYVVRALGLYTNENVENKFMDVDSEGARTRAILIATKYGLVSGYTDGTFKPDALITREEAMVMYHRAMKMAKLSGSDTERYLSYTDFSDVSEWAEESVREVLAAHVFNGTTPTTISPKANITYAEAAQAIMNLLVKAGLISE